MMLFDRRFSSNCENDGDERMDGGGVPSKLELILNEEEEGETVGPIGSVDRHLILSSYVS